MWTHFWDTSSGGGQKEKWGHIFIEAPQNEAEIIFQNRFGHNPNRVTCTCCGADYSILEEKSLAQEMAFYLGWHYDKEKNKYIEKRESGREFPKTFRTMKKALEKMSFPGYGREEPFLIIRKKDIKSKERIGELHEEGYVWK